MSPAYDSRQQRRVVLLAMMALTILAGTYFAVLNTMRGQIFLALLQSIFVLYSLVLFPVIFRARHLRPWALAYLILWTAMILIVLGMPEATYTSFIWPVLLPLMFHFMLGWRLGLAMSLGALTAAAGIAIHRYGLPQSPQEMIYVGNFVAAALVIMILSYVYERSRELAETDLHRLAVTDSLTDLPNRTLLDETFERLAALSQRQQAPMSLLLMDLDHFKTINDRFGHAGGDEVLQAFSRFLRDRLRRSDFVCRHGGEEFLVLLPATGLDEAAALAEDIRRSTETLPIDFHNEPIRLTVSIGVAELGRDGNDFDAVVSMADKRMYQGKSQGRNQVVAAIEISRPARTANDPRG
jgi:diguanylate cyclase (GGDEF)-like protein